MKGLLTGFCYSQCLNSVGLAIGQSDPYYLILAVGFLAVALRLHIGSIPKD